MAIIPKLGSQWRIIHEFNPTEYFQAVDPPRPIESLSIATGNGKTPGDIYVGLFFRSPKIALAHGVVDDNNQIQFEPYVKSTQLPKVGEWTRVEFGLEKVNEKYFLFFIKLKKNIV